MAVVAVVVALIGVAAFAAPRDASAVITDPTGVFCSHLPDVNGIVLVRIDNDYKAGGNANDAAFTAVQYVPRGSASCQNPGAANPSNLTEQTTDRPILVGKYNPATNTLTGSLCEEDVNFGVVIPGWTEITVDFTFADPPTKTVDATAFTLAENGDPNTCANADPPSTFGIDNGVWLDGPDEAIANFDSDWDGDGCLDWDELAQAVRFDPFNPADGVCSGVGGIAEIADTDAGGAPLDATSSSGTSAWLIAGIAAAAVAGTIALGGAVAYARKRADG